MANSSVCLILGSGATCGSGYKVKKTGGKLFARGIKINPPTDQKFFSSLELNGQEYPALFKLKEHFRYNSMEDNIVLIESSYWLLQGRYDQVSDEWMIKKGKSRFPK